MNLQVFKRIQNKWKIVKKVKNRNSFKPFKNEESDIISYLELQRQ